MLRVRGCVRQLGWDGTVRGQDCAARGQHRNSQRREAAYRALGDASQGHGRVSAAPDVGGQAQRGTLGTQSAPRTRQSHEPAPRPGLVGGQRGATLQPAKLIVPQNQRVKAIGHPRGQQPRLF